MLVNVVASQNATYRVLVLAAQNARLPDLHQLGDESDIAALIGAGHLHVDALTGDVSEDELAQVLLAGRYDIFHAALHGDGDGMALSNEFVERDQLGELLQVHGVTTAVLLSCESSEIAKRVAEAGVCCTIGTTVKITNEAAYAFCLKFYRHLVKNQNPAGSYEYARRLLKGEWRSWVVMYKAEDCQEQIADPYARIEAKLAQLEGEVRKCHQSLATAEANILRASGQGHEQITGATLQLVALFQGLLGGKR
jgi:hypothetical protein